MRCRQAGRLISLNGEARPLRQIVEQLIAELGIRCRIRSVPYPMLDIIARSLGAHGQ
ncbi:nucleotide di-P-sugar epimerase or dehydratase [Atlantibacter hermannii]|nr:nucleotide di-P-sugar epimerase or dehydratase [Atlantibacter hermannii]